MNDLDALRAFRSHVPEPDGATWAAVRAAVDERIRATRGGRPRWAIAVFAAAVAGIVAASALAVSGRLRGLFDGTPIPPADLAPADRFVLSSSGAEGARVELIASREERSFYVIHRRNGGACFASGEAGRSLRLGTTMCPKPGTSFGFPSATVPILDQSSLSLEATSSTSRIERLAGFAADPVARVSVIGPDGSVSFSAPVVDNVYISNVPSLPVRALAAYDDSGRELFRLCLHPDGCES